jgi:hypothetical protein
VPPSPDPIAKVLADLTQQMASLFTRLEALETRPPAITTTTITMLPGSPYGV